MGSSDLDDLEALRAENAHLISLLESHGIEWRLPPEPVVAATEPIEVRISNEELVVLSFPGPDRSIRLEEFQAGRIVSRRYRNRRIGEFLKELEMTEGCSTGIPKILKEMAANGSPAPLFETDDDRLSFVIRLPHHPLSRQLVGGKSQGKLNACCAPWLARCLGSKSSLRLV